jgi:hypothetical protein
MSESGRCDLEFSDPMMFRNAWARWLFVGSSFVLSAPFYYLVSLGQVKNEGAFIFFVPYVAGLPWVLLYSVLPFQIPGFTSAGVADANGDLYVGVLHCILIFLPVYLNLFLICKGIDSLLSRHRSRSAE